MAIIGSAYVEIRALDTNLQRDIDKAMKKVKEPLITLQSNVNLTPVRDKIRLLREELKKNPLKFSAEVDLEKANEKINRLREEQAAEILTVQADADAGAVVATLEAVKQQYQSIHADVKADADTALAETQLRLLARNRSTRVSAFIDPQTQKALKNLMYTLTGALPADKIRKAIVGLAGNFEGLAIAGAKLATVVGSIGAAGLTLGANLISLGDDVTELVGITALAPAVFAGLGAGIAATVLGWKGFSKAMTDEKELAKLPVKAQNAVLSLKGLGGEIRRVTQTSYWEEMGTSIQRLHENFFPQLKNGLEGTGKAMGKWGKGFADALFEAGKNGTLEKMFTHINKGLTNASKGVKPFTDALFTLGAVGSKYLEKMGTQLADLATRFDAWIDKSAKNGDLDKWITQAQENFKDMGRAIGGVFETFQGLNKAAEASGAKGLKEFADGLERIADKVNTPEFQNGLITVLKGARAGSDALGEGFSKITDVIGKGSATLGKFLDLAGQVGGGLFTGIAAMFDNTGLGDGIIVALQGAKEAVDILQPAFSDLGKIMGDLGEIAGTLFTSMAPGFVALMSTLQGFVNGIKDGVIAAMPIFNEFIQNIISVTSGPIVALGEGLGNILEFFAALPGPIQTVLMALAATALLAPRIEKAYGLMRKGVKGHFTNLKNEIRNSANGAATALTGLDRAARSSLPGVRENFSNLNTTMRDNFGATGRSIGDVSRTTAEGVKKSFSQAGSAVGSGFVAAGKVSASAVTAMGRSVRSDLSATVEATKRGFKHMEMESRPFRNNTQYLFEDMGDAAKKHTALASAYVRQHTIYTEKRFEDAGAAARTAATNVSTAFKNSADRSKAAFKTAGNDITSGFKAVGQNVSSALLPARVATQKIATNVVDDFKAVGQNISSAMLPAVVATEKAATKTKQAFRTVRTDLTEGYKAIAQNVSSAMLPVAVSAERAAQRTRTAFNTVRTDLSEGSRAIAQNFSSAMLPITASAQTAATRVRTGFQNLGRNVAENFAPAGQAFRNFGTQVADSTRDAGRAISTFSRNGARSITSGVGSALGGLTGALGGPFGIAIAGATIAMGLMGDEAAKKKSNLDSWAAAFNGQTGITQAVRDMVTESLKAKESFLWMETSSAADSAKNIGLGLGDIQKAAEGVPDAMKKVEDAVRTANDGLNPLQKSIDLLANAGTNEKFGALGGIIGQVFGGAKLFESDSSKTGRIIEQTKEKLRDQQVQIENTAAAMGKPVNEAAGILAAMDTLKNTASTADEKLQAVMTIIGKLNGNTESVGDKQQAYNDKVRDLGTVMDEVFKKAGEEGVAFPKLFNLTTGEILTTTEAGSKLRTSYKDIAKAGLESATAQAQAIDDPKKAQETFQKVMGETRAKLAEKLDVGGLKDPKAISKIMDQLGLELKPVEIAALLNPGTQEKMLSDLGLLDEEAKKKLTDKKIGIDADSTKLDSKVGDAKRKAAELDLVKGKATLDANPQSFNDRLNSSVTAGVKFGTNIFKSTFDGNKNPFSSNMALAVSGGAGFALKTFQAAFSGNPAQFNSHLKSVQVGGGALDRSTYTPTINANGNGESVVQNIANTIAGFAGKTFSVGISIAKLFGAGSADGSINNGQSWHPQFQPKFFANGGVEKHVAQIAKPSSTLRVWAEPETGGEAYIPLSKAKRSRSTKILEEVASMFGMTLLKTKSFANGGVEGGNGGSGGASASISSGRVSAAFVSTVAQEMLKDNTKLNEIGLNVVDGIIGGINSKQGKAVESMTNMAGSLEDAVRTRLDIHSPSKTFLGLGKYIIDGLTLGIKANAGQVHKQISTLANRIYIAASDIQKATGKSIGASMNLLNRQKTLNGAWKKMAAWKYTDQIVDYYQKTGKTGNRTLADIARAREDVNARLASAQTRLKNLQTARADVFKSVSNSIRNEYKLGTNIVGDTKPYIPKMRFSDVKNYTSGLAARLKAFNGKIAALRKKGVAAGLIEEIASLGSIEGTSVADAVLAGSNTDIKGLNSSYGEIGKMSTAIGNTTADAMYKVGIDAQSGLVRGLQKDSASLTAAANKLTSSLIAQVKKNLGIRSPSRVFAELGRFTGAGFIQGLDQMQPRLDQRVDSFINLDPRQATSTSTGTTSTTTTSPLAEKNITVNVHPTEGMDERAVAKATVTEIGWAILSQ